MKKYLSIIILLIFYPTSGQTINTLPKDENNKIHFTKVISSNTLNQLETYTRTKIFFINNFNSGKDVIQMEDKENYMILGKGNTSVNIQSGKFNIQVPMSFTIKIESKDNKCKVEIYNIYYNNETPAEQFFNNKTDENYRKANAKGKTIMESYRDQTLERITIIESKIKEEFEKTKHNW